MKNIFNRNVEKVGHASRLPWVTEVILKLSFMAIAMAVATNALHAGTITYAYDPAGRLTTTSYGGGTNQIYTYDNAGNLTQNLVTIPGGGGDTDDDGLPDAWEQQYFGNLDRDGTGDFDNDGFIDSNEFLAGTDPTSAVSLLRIVPPPQLSAGTTTVEWLSVAGKTYRLQYKDDLSSASWSDVPGDVTASGTTASKADSSGFQNYRYYRVILVP